MKTPAPRGSAVTMPRVRRWLQDFSNYRHLVNEHRVDRWIEQFADEHRDLAARVLDSVDFISSEQTTRALRAAVESIPGWASRERDRSGLWRFAAFSGSAGESGDTMLHRLRTALNLGSRTQNGMFVHRAELMSEGLGPDDTVVLVDDFAGSGQQAVDSWPMFQELLPGGPRTYLVLIAATTAAAERIQEETELELVTEIRLGPAENVFHESCSQFSEEDKAVLLEYGAVADPARPRGFGNCGLLLVFSHTCPNNSIPILHARNDRWEGLFRRYD